MTNSALCPRCGKEGNYTSHCVTLPQRIAIQVRHRIHIGGEDRGVSTWKDKQDFYGFLDLMHGKTASLSYKQGVRRFIFSHQDEIKMYEYEEVDNLT